MGVHLTNLSKPRQHTTPVGAFLIGRAIGEAMAVMMVAGNSPNMPDSLFRSVTFLTTAIAKEMSYASGLQKQALFSIVLVLFVFIMVINVLLNAVLKGGNKDEK